jgi:hypothetical protein
LGLIVRFRAGLFVGENVGVTNLVLTSSLNLNVNKRGKCRGLALPLCAALFFGVGYWPQQPMPAPAPSPARSLQATGCGARTAWPSGRTASFMSTSLLAVTGSLEGSTVRDGALYVSTEGSIAVDGVATCILAVNKRCDRSERDSAPDAAD